MCGRQSGAFPAGPATAVGPSFIMDPTTYANIRRSFTPDGDGIYGWCVTTNEAGEPAVLPGDRLGPPPTPPPVDTPAPRHEPTAGEVWALLDLPESAARALFEDGGIGWTVDRDGNVSPHVLVAPATALARGIRWLPAGLQVIAGLIGSRHGLGCRHGLRVIQAELDRSPEGTTIRAAGLRALAKAWR